MPVIDFPSGIGQAMCGTLTATPVSASASASFYVGDTVPTVTTGYSYIPQPTYYPYTYPWSYSYTDPRVTALEAKVETLEKMLAAVLSGGGNCKPRAKRRKGAKGGGV
jgi:hypothetical protein